MRETLAVLTHERRQDKGERGGIVKRCESGAAGEQQEIHIGEHIGNLEIAEPVLHRTEELPGTSEAQILLGETKAVTRPLDDLKPLL